MAKRSERPIAYDPQTEWTPEQERLAREYRELIEDAFDALPGSGRFYFSHAAAVLRQLADEMA
jgi:hypothetical protein